jgi:rhodanese-related sulfurtransferase
VATFTHSHVPEVSADAAMTLIADGATLIDIREPNEWLAGHAPMATHIPLGELGVAAQGLSTTDALIFICRSGRRSDQAVGALVRAGFNAINLSGGMHAWQLAGGAVVRDDGSTGMVI